MTGAHFCCHTLMYDAIDTMMDDHNHIWQVLDLLEDCQSRMNMRGQAPDAEQIESALDYLSVYSKRIHQNGNDILLHQLLRERVPEAEALLSRQTEDHVVGSVRISELKALLKKCTRDYASGRELFSKQLSRFIFAFRKHVKREEGVVIPLAREHLQADDWARLVYCREQVEDPLFGAGNDPSFRALRRSLRGSGYDTSSPLASGLQAVFSKAGRSNRL